MAKDHLNVPLRHYHYYALRPREVMDYFVESQRPEGMRTYRDDGKTLEGPCCIKQ